MAKSAGNFYRLIDLEEKYKNTPKNILYRAIRLLYIGAKYATELDFTFDKIDSNITVIK
jgi:cysteinyl-tRNA synthetase